MRRSRYVTSTNQLLERIALLLPSRLSTRHKTTSSMPRLHPLADQVKVVILVKTPNHGPNQAMDCRSRSPATQNQVAAEPAQHLQGTHADLDCPIPTTGDLTPWAQQGVLLLNTTLPCASMPQTRARETGWSTLTDYVIERRCQLPQPVVFAWGRFAQQMVEGKLVATGAGKATGSSCLASTHPSPLANRATAELLPLWGRVPPRQPISY